MLVTVVIASIRQSSVFHLRGWAEDCGDTQDADIPSIWVKIRESLLKVEIFELELWQLEMRIEGSSRDFQVRNFYAGNQKLVNWELDEWIFFRN